ncbi:DNA-binding GntR family transcriptional regulator [Roseibium hamelinense]|uniref:DNA-binding GntR family transcriptional regulator n=1 Tax=Roseibium hamelinense TaxID=150831 RepID=A0A562SVM9_9HYPH|nr:GntR family transcriptional regulator [Roseibium hamelinense]MTI43171.1 GntR family transcriptional regulator [Roseibium hamelinense]TWI84780.1 DNA-binding GntR family transcriptional regulator [Roseibium hamelinense]
MDTIAPSSQLAKNSGSKTARKSQAVYLALQKRILVGELTQESPVTEQALAQEFNCSQGTIREALLSLREDGLVVRRGYQGTFVTKTTDDEAVVLLKLRRDIETASVDRLVAKASDLDLRYLSDLADKYDERRDNRDIYGTSNADLAFHMALIGIADMPILEPILRRTILHLHRFIITRHQGQMQWISKINASHQAILDAVSNGNTELTRTLVAEHVTSNTIQVSEDVRTNVFARIANTPVTRIK